MDQSDIQSTTTVTSDSRKIKLAPADRELSIITVNYKSVDYLIPCLRSLEDHLKTIDYEIIIVDNHSQDGSVATIRNNFPGYKLIENSDNVGYARANNQGIRVSCGKYILLLNNDTEVRPGAIEHMIQVMDQNRDIGIVGGRLFNPDGTPQPCFGKSSGPWVDFFRKNVVNKLFQNYHRPWARRIVEYLHSRQQEVDWVCGACLMIRREALEDSGLLDENFFMYLEDMDLGTTVRKQGWKVWFAPESSVVHHRGASVSKNSPRASIEYRRSQLYFYKKHYGVGGLLFIKAWLYWKFILARKLYTLVGIGKMEKNDPVKEEAQIEGAVMEMIRNYR